MVYDQAQSARIGQKVPIESTFVQVFDVDPATPTADLVEAAWPGMLIFRNDTSMLMIFDGDLDGWREVAGGVAGSVTYVGTSQPTGGTYNIGDTWYDQDAGMKAYVWDGDSWEPVTGEGGIRTFRQPAPPTSTSVGDIWIDSDDGEKQYRSNAVGVNTISPKPPGTANGWVLVQDTGIPTAQQTADRKTRAYYVFGYAPDDGDPVTPPVFVPLTTAPDGSPLTPGDVWYQTDAQNRVWFWTGTAWVDATDPNTLAALGQANANQGALEDINIALENLTLIGSSTNNTADTADGRISTSDYIPGPDDLTYIQYRKELDTTAIPPVETITEYVASRENGSIWFVQTRPRVNQCTNPSVEANTIGWTSSGATIARDNPARVPVGTWALKVTASGATDHQVSWGETTPALAKPGETWTASMYAGLVSGNGWGVYLELVWLDANGVFISSTPGTGIQLISEIWTSEDLQIGGEARMWVTGVAPLLAAGVYVRQVSPAGANDSDVWYTEALILEKEKDVGRYFDGHSYDGYWSGTPDNSVSQLNGDKIVQVWELRNGEWVRKFFADDAMAPIDSSQIVGSFDAEILSDNTIVQDKQYAALVLAFEDLDVGDIVNVYNDHGVFTARKADASVTKNYEAHGFIIDTTVQGASVRVYHSGYNRYLAGLSPGAAWLSPTPGKVQNRPAHEAGQLIQQVGFAPSTSTLNFSPRMAIKIN